MFGRGLKIAVGLRKGEIGDETEASDMAEQQYAAWQGHLANLMMMGTLIFGFVVTGTFLSVSFTGEEPFEDNDNLLNFTKQGLRSAVFSLLATMVAFIFSSRTANLYIHAGALHALRSISRGLLFIGIAEVLLIYSLHTFMYSMEDFTKMFYYGPKLCPFRDNHHAPITEWQNSTFCAQTGKAFYETAAKTCGAVQVNLKSTKTQYSAHSHQKMSVCETNRLTSSSHYEMCYVYDCYHTFGKDKDTGVTFAWGDFESPDQGYSFHTISGKEINKAEIFHKVILEGGELMCDVANAQHDQKLACAPAIISNGTLAQRSFCATAETALIAADTCAGGKFDDAIKCHKVCQFVGEDHAQTMKEKQADNLNFYFAMMHVILTVMMLGRGLVALILCVRGTVRNIRAEGVWCLLALDIFGIYEVSTRDFVDGDEAESGDADEESIPKATLKSVRSQGYSSMVKHNGPEMEILA